MPSLGKLAPVWQENKDVNKDGEKRQGTFFFSHLSRESPFLCTRAIARNFVYIEFFCGEGKVKDGEWLEGGSREEESQIFFGRES